MADRLAPFEERSRAAALRERAAAAGSRARDAGARTGRLAKRIAAAAEQAQDAAARQAPDTNRQAVRNAGESAQARAPIDATLDPTTRPGDIGAFAAGDRGLGTTESDMESFVTGRGGRDTDDGGSMAGFVTGRDRDRRDADSGSMAAFVMGGDDGGDDDLFTFGGER
jgi:hypothetical protein